MQERPLRFLKEKHDVQLCISQSGIDNITRKHTEGLDHFDVIFMEPYFPFHPRYTYEETDSSTQTGWFLYKDLMKDLKKAKIVILTYPTEQYTYGPNNYPEREWGPNVTIRRKSTEDNYLIQIVKELCPEENIKAKQGEIMLFKDLPLNKKFYFHEDAEATKLNGGFYLQYYVKDEETVAHPCFTTEGCKTCRPLGVKFDVNPEAPIIFLNINAL